MRLDSVSDVECCTDEVKWSYCLPFASSRAERSMQPTGTVRMTIESLTSYFADGCVVHPR